MKRRMTGRLDSALSSATGVATCAVAWTVCNRKKALAIAGTLFALLVVASAILAPGKAEAIPAIPIVVAVIALVGGGLAANEAADAIEDVLRGLVQCEIGWVQTLAVNTANGALLQATFETLLGDESISAALYNIHHVAVIPLANIIAVAMFTYGLVKLVSKAGQTEGGIDAWQLIFLFVMLGIAKTVIDASWEVMVALYKISFVLMGKMLPVGDAALTLADPTEGIENAGMLFAMVIASLFVVLVGVFVCALSHAVVIVRAIQIYVYTVFAPIPIAFMVVEGGREMTKGFFKRYVALLLSGAVLALLFYMFCISMKAAPIPTDPVTDVGSFAVWATTLVLKYIVFYGAFGWAVFKSGAWTRELLGV